MITIVDYGSGNIRAIQNIYKRLKIDCTFASSPDELIGAKKIILPGVGAFDESIKQLTKSGMTKVLNELVIDKKTPILGICVGMQIMAKKSDEGQSDGLGWFDAEVRKFDVNKLVNKPKVPHMGWNSILPVRESKILHGVDKDIGFYFLHSYYFDCAEQSDVLCQSHYGENFACAVNKNNIYGFQFHPEKSHSNGITLFKNFAEIDEC